MTMSHPLRGCRWIAASRPCQSPVIRRRFSCGKPLWASVSVTGLGYFDARINGLPLSGHCFQPVTSEYGPRDLTKLSFSLYDRLTFRVYYCTYDVSALLREGENELSIQLGNGFYRQDQRLNEGRVSYGDTLKAIYCLTLGYGDRVERICSDGSEVWQDSRIRFNNLYLGEVHDLSFVPGPEEKVTVLPDAQAELSPQTGAPDREIRTLKPVLLSERDGLRIYDAGENVSGLVRLRVKGGQGQWVILRFAENLTEDGALDFESAGLRNIMSSGVPQRAEPYSSFLRNFFAFLLLT